MKDDLVLKNLEDGRLLLLLNGKHLFANTPKYTKTFHGVDAMEQWFAWILKNVHTLEWMEDRRLEVKDEGIVIDLS